MLPLLAGASASFGAALLEDFGTRRLNGEGTALFDAYTGENGSETVTYPGSTGAFPLGGKTLQMNVGRGAHPMVYMHFHPYSGGYAFPGGYAQHFLKSGTWDPAFNRLGFWVKSTMAVEARAAGNFQFGTYVRSHAEPDPSRQGDHYYHLLSGSFPAGKWVYVEINPTPQHQVGKNSSTNWGVIPGYFDDLTRFYFDGAYAETPGAEFEFADFGFRRAMDEPDAEVATVSIAYDGAKYVLGFSGLKNTARKYEIRFSPHSMKADGFASGTSGGTFSNPGDDYCGVFWSSPIMPENPVGMYVAIMPNSGTAFTEIYCRSLSGTSGTRPIPGKAIPGTLGQRPVPILNIAGRTVLSSHPPTKYDRSTYGLPRGRYWGVQRQGEHRFMMLSP